MLFPYVRKNKAYSINAYFDVDEDTFLEGFYKSKERTAWNLSQPVIYSISALGMENRPYVLTYYRKVYDKWTMEPLGVLAIMVGESYIAKLYNNIPMGKTGYCYIQDEQGKVFSSANPDLLGMRIKDYSMSENDNVVVSIPYPKLGWNIVGV